MDNRKKDWTIIDQILQALEFVQIQVKKPQPFQKYSIAQEQIQDSPHLLLGFFLVVSQEENGRGKHRMKSKTKIGIPLRIGLLRICRLSVLLALIGCLTFLPSHSWAGGIHTGTYVLIGWNDLGMHCINPSYQELAILPPFNNLWVQVIQRGDPPRIVTDGVSVEYSVDHNTTVEGKTDFWQYALQLFAVDLPLGIGLTGNGLSGKMIPVGDHFEATGIPLLPYDDKMNWNPFQTATVKLKNPSGRVLKTAKVVLPVSDEINCAKCHAQGMDGTVNLPEGGVDSVNTNILMVHDYYNGANGVSSTGPNLQDMKPVLCARCHSSNALGAPGDGQSKSVSLAMHGWHNPDRAPDAGCYDCHPGATTQCLRTAVGGMGYTGTTPSCESGLCHGGREGVASSVVEGRQPWLQEPTCEQCHGANYSTGQDLYRHSKGHGGIYCTACHNSPHVWWPSKLRADNLQPHKLQGAPYAMADCGVCHSKKKQGDSPHVEYYSSLKGQKNE